MCLQCWQKGKKFRLHWHSFVRVQIYYKYWLSINRTNTRSILNRSWRSGYRTGLKNQGSWVRIPPESFSSESNYYYFFISLSFLFIFLNFEVKQCANMYWKYDNTGFAMEKKPNFFIFQNGIYPTKGQNKTYCVVIKLSIQGTKLLSRWRWPCTWWQILYKREKERFMVLEER